MTEFDYKTHLNSLPPLPMKHRRLLRLMLIYEKPTHEACAPMRKKRFEQLTGLGVPKDARNDIVWRELGLYMIVNGWMPGVEFLTSQQKAMVMLSPFNGLELKGVPHWMLPRS